MTTYVVTTEGLDDATVAEAAISDVNWAVATGTADAIIAAYDPATAALTDGLILAFRATGSNLTTTPTFAPDGLVPHTIVKRGGVVLKPGDIPGALAECLVRYNLANTRWELLNPARTNQPWVVAAGTADVITATYPTSNAALYDGLTVTFRAAATNLTTTPTFAPDGLTAHTITKEGGAVLAAGDILINGEYEVRYNLANTRWEIINPTPESAIAVAAAALDLHKILLADTAGADSSTAQPWFPSAGAVTVATSGVYFFEGTLFLSRAAGTTSHTTGVLFGGTATLTAIHWLALAKTGDANDLQPVSGFMSSAATIQVLKAASTSATEQVEFHVRGIVQVNAGGTLIPQFKYSAAPGGAPTVKIGTFFRLRTVNTNPQGTWA